MNVSGKTTSFAPEDAASFIKLTAFFIVSSLKEYRRFLNNGYSNHLIIFLYLQYYE